MKGFIEIENRLINVTHIVQVMYDGNYSYIYLETFSNNQIDAYFIKTPYTLDEIKQLIEEATK